MQIPTSQRLAWWKHWIAFNTIVSSKIMRRWRENYWSAIKMKFTIFYNTFLRTVRRIATLFIYPSKSEHQSERNKWALLMLARTYKLHQFIQIYDLFWLRCISLYFFLSFPFCRIEAAHFSPCECDNSHWFSVSHLRNYHLFHFNLKSHAH